jgi:hypothetical protein
MYSPSGVHSGLTYRSCFPLVICTVSARSRESVHRFSPPSRSEVNTMRFPSGLKRGWVSKPMPRVSRFACPPVIDTVKRSPR